MKKVSDHCWGTPKCGISLLTNVFAKIEKPVQYRFLLARNPYYRVFSVYTEKAIDVNGRYAKQHKINKDNHTIRGIEMRRSTAEVIPIGRIDRVDRMSFKDFVLALNRSWLNEHSTGNLHIARQVTDMAPFVFDDIFWLEDVPNCFKIASEKLGCKPGEIPLDKDLLWKMGGTDNWRKGDHHGTPRSDDLNRLAEPYKLPAMFWWNEDAVPSNYDIMFDDEMREHIYDLYHEDFDYLGIKK
tara:strand:- start:1776 stop:2498 length:723 start_codon:yes stop_codon:yes gene_type:complete